MVGMARAEKIGRRDEVGIEDGDVRALVVRESVRQGAGLVADAVRPADLLDVQPRRLQRTHQTRGHGDGLVGAVVENLDVQAIARPVECRNRGDHAADDVRFIVDGKLDQDVRQVRAGQGWRQNARRATGTADVQRGDDEKIARQRRERGECEARRDMDQSEDQTVRRHVRLYPAVH